MPALDRAMIKDNTRPLVLSGPSGAGKSSLLQRLFKEYPGVFGFSVSHTTRKPREGEVPGQSYHYTTREHFNELVQSNQFIEWAEYSKNLYGTSIQAIESVTSNQKICVLDIDMQGVKNIKNSSLYAHYLFVAPPSIEALEARLRGRGTESPETLSDRLAAASAEMEFSKIPGIYDRVLVNVDLETTYREFKSFVASRYDLDL